MKQLDKHYFKRGIERLRVRVICSTDRDKQLQYRARAEAAAEDHRELLGKDYVEGGR